MIAWAPKDPMNISLSTLILVLFFFWNHFSLCPTGCKASVSWAKDRWWVQLTACKTCFSKVPDIYNGFRNLFDFQPRPQGFSLKKTPHPFFEGKTLGTRLFDFYQRPKYENNVKKCPKRRQTSKIKTTLPQFIHVGGSLTVHNPCSQIVTE